METNRKLEVIRSQTAKLIEAVEPRNEDGVRYTPEERKEIIAKRRAAEFVAAPDGTVDIFRFLPKTPEQVELEENKKQKTASHVAHGTLFAGFSALGYDNFIQDSRIAAVLALLLFTVSIMYQMVRYELGVKARKEVRRLEMDRSLTVPISAKRAYDSIVKNAKKIEEGDYPPSVVASARLSLEGVQGHMKLIGEHTEMGRASSKPCRNLLDEVYRIASEMDAYLTVEEQEEQKLARALRRELGSSSPEHERADEAIQQTRGLTF